MGLYKLNPVVTHSLKAACWSQTLECIAPIKRESGFKSLLSTFDLRRYNAAIVNIYRVVGLCTLNQVDP